MAEFTNRRPHHGEDRYAQKLKAYEGLHVLAAKVSPANSAIIWIYALGVGGLVVLGSLNVNWPAYLIFFALSVLCLVAVWQDKNAKPKQKRSNGSGSTELRIPAADLRATAGGSAPK